MRKIIPQVITAKFMQFSPRCITAPPLILVILMLLQPIAMISSTDEISSIQENYPISARDEGSNNSSGETITTLAVLATHQNAANGHTYHLLEAGNRSFSSLVAQSLGGELVSIDDSSENQWIVSTFTSWNGTPRNLWTGLSDVVKEGFWEWDATQPSWYRNWAKSEPTMLPGEDFAIISSQPTTTGVEIGQWMDSVEEPEGVLINGLVEVGGGLDHAIYFPQAEEESENSGEADAYAILSEVEGLSIGDSLTLEARVMPENLEGTRFIMMKGDYGWGMQLTDGVLQYSNEYAIRNHPAAEDVVLVENEWAHLAITVEEGVGGAFWIDGQWVANISAEDAIIPMGDFGSNSCYQSGSDCDEFYVARQGAGCDCNHYIGSLDDIKVWNRSLSAQEVADSYNGVNDPASSNDSAILELTFDEGTGQSSVDAAQNLKIELFHAIWVDLDGNALNNPEQLFNDDEMWNLAGKEGTQHIFWIEVPERVQFLNIQFWGWDGQAFMYVRRGAIPTESSNDYASSQNNRGDDIDFGWGNGYFAWPEAGVYWIIVEGESQFDHYSLSVWWNQLPPPPPLEQMTELHDGIPVPDQDIASNHVSYYYVDVTEPIDIIEISTYGGKGDADLYVAHDTDPTEWSGNGIWWGEDGDAIGGRQGQPGGNGQGSGEQSSTQGEEKFASSSGPDNDEKVTLYGPIDGIWCIAVEAFEKVSDLTIVARFTYPPANAEPINSIELEPGVPYSPVDGNKESDRHFHINVSNSVERLEVQLEGGEGDADLYVSYEEVPSRDDNHLHSATFGNSEFTAVDTPLSGTYHILVTGWGQFNDATITASFTEASEYIPEILPIRLFNEEPVHNLRAMEGDELAFYVDIDDGVDSLTVMLSSGSGNPNLYVDHGDDDWQSTRQGVWETIWIEEPTQGRYDIRVVAARDFDSTSITASWYDWNSPVIPDIPDEIMVDCKETAEFMMDLLDSNSDGVLDMDEIWAMGNGQWEDDWEDDWDIGWEDESDEGEVSNSDSSTSGRQRQPEEPPVSDDDDPFTLMDSDDNGEISYNELLIFACSCSTELELAEELYGDMDEEDFNAFNWKNDFTFKSLDLDGDGMVDWNEFSRAQDSCETTWDPFGLNEGDDPGREPADVDDGPKDGILGTEYLADIDDEVLYSMVAGVGILLLLLVIMAFAQVKKSDELETWGAMEGDVISRQTEAMLNRAGPPQDSTDMMSSEQSSSETVSTSVVESSQPSPAPIELASTTVDMGDMLSDLGIDDIPMAAASVATPPDHIMGSLQGDGSESLEWPSGSGNHFTRASFDASWSQK